LTAVVISWLFPAIAENSGGGWAFVLLGRYGLAVFIV
jgi:hypothetical protein